MMAILAHFLVPTAQDRLAIRQNEISQDVTARLLTEGIFLHPAEGVTLYTREIGEDGVLRDVFLSDRRDPNVRVIYTAANAYLVRRGAQTSLIMVDGLAQRLNAQDTRLAVGNFKDFSYDISTLVDTSEVLNRPVRTMITPELSGNWEQIAERTGQSVGFVAEEFHSRFAHPAFAAIAALLGFSVLMSGGFSRFGAWREILFAIGALLLLDGLRAMVTDPVRDNAQMWPIVYTPVIVGLALVGLLLMFAAKPFRRRNRVAA
jgi:lipopolysaccharide export system permease protein